MMKDSEAKAPELTVRWWKARASDKTLGTKMEWALGIWEGDAIDPPASIATMSDAGKRFGKAEAAIETMNDAIVGAISRCGSIAQKSTKLCLNNYKKMVASYETKLTAAKKTWEASEKSRLTAESKVSAEKKNASMREDLESIRQQKVLREATEARMKLLLKLSPIEREYDKQLQLFQFDGDESIKPDLLKAQKRRREILVKLVESCDETLKECGDGDSPDLKRLMRERASFQQRLDKDAELSL